MSGLFTEITIADFVQKVFYAMYGVRLDTRQGVEGAYHSKTDKFKEVVMEANNTLQEFQQSQDWNFYRDRLELGISKALPNGRIQEFSLPRDVYKPCTGYNDAVRLHHLKNKSIFIEIPWTSPRSGTHNNREMHDYYGRPNATDNRIKAFLVGRDITFTRPFTQQESNLLIETDIIRWADQLHICEDSCPDNCPKAYKDNILTEIPDPLYIILRTAARRAVHDPSLDEAVLIEDAKKILSAMRENDSAKTFPDTYKTSALGFIEVL